MTAARRRALDQENRDHITGHHGTSLCVEAGAGTGKTSLMVERVVCQVLEGTSISRIAAITFTEKAAAELKLRVRQELERQSARSARAADALARLDTSPISTIHGLAGALLRERPVEAGLDPNFTQLDELGAGLLLDQVWDAWLETALARPNDAIRNALLSGFRLGDIRKLFSQLYRKRKHLSALPAAPGRLEDVPSQVRQAIETVRAWTGFCRTPDDHGLVQWQEAFALYDTAQPVDVPGLIKFCSRLSLNPNLGKQGNWSGNYGSRQKEAAAQLKRICGNVGASILSDLLQLLASAPGGTVAAVEKEKNARDMLDFDDLLLRARNLVADDRLVRRYFQDQYDSVIVDEFQDTDPLQVEIVFFLCEETPEARHWQDVRLKPGKLCIVGDPKQAIYRFRGADIETYTDARERIAAQGAVVLIQENFRAVHALVEWTNGVFKNVIRETESYQPRYEDLLTSQPPLPDSAPAVTLLCPPENQDKPTREMEAAGLVGALRRIRDEQWPVRDSSREGAFRAPRWSDVAILMRALTDSHVYEAALRAADIPYRLEGGKQFFARQEIHALVACLKCIDDPGDEIALAAALKSLFFGFSDEDLLRLRLHTGTLSYLRPPDAVSGGDSHIVDALALLRSLHEGRNLVSLAATLERLYRETHALEKHLLTYSGRQAVANLRKALLRARNFEALGGATFWRFARWLLALAEEAAQEPESALVESEEDAVQLLTIHKAKGLEFPIVILANLTSRGDGDMAVWNRQSQLLEFRVKIQNRDIATAGFDQAREAEKQRAEAEEKRLLYVAATRARDHLLISVFLSRNQGGLFDLLGLEPRVPEGVTECVYQGMRCWRVPPVFLPRDPELSTVVTIDAEPGPTWEERRQDWELRRHVALERAAVSRAPLSATGVKAPEFEPSFASPRISAGRHSGPILGTAFHRLLYRIDLGDLQSQAAPSENWRAARKEAPEYLEKLVLQTALESGLETADDLSELLRQPLPQLLADAFAGARAVIREVPFLIELNGEGSGLGPALYEGIIDVVVEQADGTLLILDYKTDSVSADEVEGRMEAYRAQGSIYRAAAEKGSDRSVSDVLFYFVRPGVVYSQKVQGILA